MYQLSVMNLAEWFGVGDPVCAREFDLKSVWDSEMGTHVLVLPSEEVFRVFVGMLQGWTWALHFCTMVVQWGVERAVGAELIVRDGAPFPQLGRTCGAVYADNLSVLGLDAKRDDVAVCAATENLEEAGFTLHEVQCNTNTAVTVDIEVSSKGLKTRHDARRAWRLYRRTRRLLGLRRCSGRSCRSSSGTSTTTSPCCGRRCLFSITLTGLARRASGGPSSSRTL